MEFIKKIQDYMPLLIIVGLIIIATITRQIVYGHNHIEALHDFTGLIFIVFGSIKLIHWSGFVEAYRSYDLIAQRSLIYAYCYPLCEVLFGLLLFMRFYTIPACVGVLILSSLSSIGVINELRKDNPFPCACLGTIFVLPMTWITLFENLFMMAMTIWLFYLSW